MNYKIIAFFILICGVITGCNKDDDSQSKSQTTTLLVYMLANNSLSSSASTNITQLQNVATKENIGDGHLLIYKVFPDSNPQLIELKEDDKGVVNQNIIKEYDYSNSADPAVLNEVINDVITLYPANNYGLDLWSHGSSWLPVSYANMLRSFGQDGNNYMEIDELANGIPDNVFNFIMFDACSMGSIECVYELKDKAEYIIASPTEIMANGWPYKNIISYIFLAEPDVKNIAEAFYNYYNAQSGDSRTATISVTNTAALDELAQITKEIISSKTEEELKSLDVSQMQLLDHFQYSTGLLYDFNDYIRSIGNDEQYALFTAALNKAIIYEAHTPTAYFQAPRRSYTIDRCSGLSSYILRSEYPTLNSWYTTRLKWAQAIYN